MEKVIVERAWAGRIHWPRRVAQRCGGDQHPLARPGREPCRNRAQVGAHRRNQAVGGLRTAAKFTHSPDPLVKVVQAYVGDGLESHAEPRDTIRNGPARPRNKNHVRRQAKQRLHVQVVERADRRNTSNRRWVGAVSRPANEAARQPERTASLGSTWGSAQDALAGLVGFFRRQLRINDVVAEDARWGRLAFLAIGGRTTAGSARPTGGKRDSYCEYPNKCPGAPRARRRTACLHRGFSGSSGGIRLAMKPASNAECAWLPQDASGPNISISSRPHCSSTPPSIQQPVSPY